MVSSKLAAGLAFAGFLLFAGPSLAAPDCSVQVHMRRGTDTIAYSGRLTRGRESCDYHFKARAGQTLTWSLDGLATRQVIAYPDGNADGPGIPDSPAADRRIRFQRQRKYDGRPRPGPLPPAADDPLAEQQSTDRLHVLRLVKARRPGVGLTLGRRSARP
ncbi:MAG TPA: hypothetical protein VG407_04130 [Caulobacteraceae bacterium]|jgi:hypothetical protein|nr:hypothetical protein [Caulobacteraceae bacterium]